MRRKRRFFKHAVAAIKQQVRGGAAKTGAIEAQRFSHTIDGDIDIDDFRDAAWNHEAKILIAREVADHGSFDLNRFRDFDLALWWNGLRATRERAEGERCQSEREGGRERVAHSEVP